MHRLKKRVYSPEERARISQNKNVLRVGEAGISYSPDFKVEAACTPDRTQREKADYQQYLLIKDIFQKRNRKAGWRVIKMNLERQAVIMNHKKIRRLMKKYGLVTQIRRRNPYKYLAKATQEHRTAPNVPQVRSEAALQSLWYGPDLPVVR